MGTKHSSEFRQEAVRVALTSGLTRKQVAEALQMHGSSRFQRWAKSSSDRMVITNRMGFVRIDGNPSEENLASRFSSCRNR